MIYWILHSINFLLLFVLGVQLDQGLQVGQGFPYFLALHLYQGYHPYLENPVTIISLNNATMTTKLLTSLPGAPGPPAYTVK